MARSRASVVTGRDIKTGGDGQTLDGGLAELRPLTQSLKSGTCPKE